MGEMVSVRVLTGLMKDHQLPEGMNVTWDEMNEEQVSYAAGIFEEYLREGWMAFGEGGKGMKQIFKFDSSLAKIILIPPLGGG